MDERDLRERLTTLFELGEEHAHLLDRNEPTLQLERERDEIFGEVVTAFRNLNDACLAFQDRTG